MSKWAFRASPHSKQTCCYKSLTTTFVLATEKMNVWLSINQAGVLFQEKSVTKKILLIAWLENGNDSEC